MEIKKDIEISIGKLGKIMFKKGYYVYVGSALNSLTKRIERHLKKEKRKHWHIDYFIDNAEIRYIFCLVSKKYLETNIAKKLKGKPIKGFGSTDTKLPSHLFYYGNIEMALKDIFSVLNDLSKSFSS